MQVFARLFLFLHFRLYILYASDSQSVGRGPLVGREGTAGGPREVIYNK